MNKNLSRKFSHIAAASVAVLGMGGILMLSNAASPSRILAQSKANATNSQSSVKKVDSDGRMTSSVPQDVQTFPPRVLLARSPLQSPAPPVAASESTSRLSLIHTLKANAALTLSFSPDGRTLATTPMSLELWDVETGKLKKTLGDDDYPIIARAIFSPTKPLAAVLLGNDRTYQDALVLWNIESGQILKKLKGPKPDQSFWRGFAFSLDGKLLATSQGGKNVASALLIWDVETGKIIKTLSEVEKETSATWRK